MSTANNQQVSVSATKASFLQAQTRLLSAPLQISAAYRAWLHDFNAANAANAGPALSDRHLTALQKRVNDKISQHTKAVFSNQSISHVAEQIETLYWNQVRAELSEEERQGEGEGESKDADGSDPLVAVEEDTPLTYQDVVEGLPDTLEEVLLHPRQNQEETKEERERRYEQLRVQLLALAKKRGAAERRLQRYQRLQELLQPYETTAAAATATATATTGSKMTAEIRAELGRTRALLAQVDVKTLPHSPLLREESRRTGQTRTFHQKLQEVVELG